MNRQGKAEEQGKTSGLEVVDIEKDKILKQYIWKGMENTSYPDVKK